MKKILLFFVVVLSFSFATAQLPNNSIAPDFTATDINGVSHNLYAYLDSGYTVVLDLSAAWCGPCWSVHQSGVLQDLHDAYGPNGTNEMRIFYIESESTNSLDQLYGINSTNGGGANRATDSYGDWVGSHTFTFIDNSSIANAYQLQSFPTLYTICPERLTRVFVGSPPGGFSTSDFYNIATACGGVATETRDPSLLTYTGEELAYCATFDGSVVMQNHGTTPLTTATVELKQGGNTIATQNWSGNLATYQTAVVNFTGVSFSAGSAVTAEITSPDDDLTNNNLSFDVDVLGSSAQDIIEGMESGSLATYPAGLYLDKTSDWLPFILENDDFNNPPSQEIGGFGQSAKSMLFDFYNEQSGRGAIVFDKLNVPADADSIELDFSYAHAQYQTESDRLLIEVSSDCGATWTEVFNEAGSSLSTAGATTSLFVPQTTDWVAVNIDLNAFAGEEIIVRFVGVSNYGNSLWLDDINISFKTVSSIDDLAFETSLNLSPVPASSVLNIDFALENEQNVQLSMLSIDGKVIASQEFTQVKDVNTFFNVSDVENGVYFISVATESGISTRKFVVNHK